MTEIKTETIETIDVELVAPVLAQAHELLVTDSSRDDLVATLTAAKAGLTAIAAQNAALTVIASPDEYGQVADLRKLAKTHAAQIDAAVEQNVRSAHGYWRAWTGLRDALKKPLAAVDDAMEQKQLAYRRAEERKARELQEKLAREAREKEERERARLAKLEDDARQRAADAAKAGDAAKAREAEAKAEQFAARQEQVVMAPIPVITANIPKVKGQSERKTWKARLLPGGKQLLVAAAATQPTVLAYLTVDESALNEFARRTKGEIALPGVEFFEDVSIASGGVK